MFLEHYPSMTSDQLTELTQQAMEKWSLDAALVVHRVRGVNPRRTDCLGGGWSAHRAAAFAACRESWKPSNTPHPFWKRETLADEFGALGGKRIRRAKLMTLHNPVFSRPQSRAFSVSRLSCNCLPLPKPISTLTRLFSSTLPVERWRNLYSQRHC